MGSRSDEGVTPALHRRLSTIAKQSMVLQIDANGVLINGPYANNREVSVENSYDGEISPKDIKKEDGVSGKLRSPTLSAAADGGSPSDRKGVGLKKWRRIRRDHVKDVINPFADSGKMLKRGLSSSINQSKPQFSSPDVMKHHGEGSIGSESTESSTVPISIPDSRFAVGADSDSEDRGSKTSTAAIGPKTRQPRSAREKNRIMNATGRSFRPGKGLSEGSKKPRGEVEESSEDDDDDDDDDDDATAFLENHEESRDQDFMADSVLTLQSAQEALEREVQKLGTIGREANPMGSSFDNDGEFANFASTNPDTSDPHLDSQSRRQKSCSEIQVLQMIEKGKVLQRKLEESTAMLAAKELRITELQTGTNHCRSTEEESDISTMDGIYRQKIETEVGYLVLTRTMQAMKRATGIEGQKGLVEEQVEMVNEPRETESKGAKLNDKRVESEEVAKEMQRRVCKVSCCLMLELVLLVLVLWVFLLELWVEPGVVVPT